MNLRLFARWMDALQADPEYAAAEREHRLVLDELRQLYLIRLDHALQAEAAVTARTDGHAHTLAMASADALEAVRLLDATHLARVGELHDDFYGTWRLEERGTIAAHRAEVGELLSSARSAWSSPAGTSASCSASCTCSTCRRTCPPRVVAWSAGAMALTTGWCSSTTGRRRAPR